MLWRTSIREIRSRPVRSLLTITSIVIGVGAVVAVSLANGSLQRSYQSMQRTVTGDTAFEITAAGGAAFDEAALDPLAEAPGVRAAVPLIQRSTIMYFQGRRAKISAMGIDPQRDRAVRDFEVAEGALFPDGEGVALNEQFARGLDLGVGDSVRLLTPRGLMSATIVGLLRPRTEAAVSHGATLFLPIELAQRRFRAQGQLDRIQIVLEEGAEEEAAMAALAQRLPEGLEIHRPATRSRMADETTVALEQGMKLASWFSLLAGAFIITNTFSMNVSQRRKQLAIMRAIGATRGQVARLIYREALIMAAVGSICGVAAGVAGAYLLTLAMGTLFQTHLPPLELELVPLALAVAMGVGISLVGSFLPARRAAKMTPLEAMSPLSTGGARGVSWRTTRWSLAGLALALGLLAARLAGWLPWYDPVFGTVLVLLFTVPLVPLSLPLLSGLVARLLQPWASVEARLARLQLLRHRGRTALTIGVLFVAASTAVGLSISLVDNVRDIRRWREQAIVGDFFVRASMPDMQTGLSAAVPDALGGQLQAAPGVVHIDPARFVSATVQGESAIVAARGFTTEDDVRFDMDDYDRRDLRSRLMAGEVVMGSVLAQRTGLAAGEKVELQTLAGPQSLRIAAVSNDYLAGGLTLHMQMDVARRLLGVEGVDAFVVKADPDRLDEAGAALQRIAEQHGLILQSFADISRLIDSMMAGVVGGLWALLTLGLIVAAFGMTNTLNMNVLEQTRELAMLRVVAMTRPQVRRLILSQAIMLAVIGLVPGVALGVALAYAINVTTLPATGHSIAFGFHPWLVAGVLVVSMALVIAAALLPAQRASRLAPSEALRYE